MQNNPKTELHMHADPQIRICLQLFWSIATIFIFSTAISLRSHRNFFHIQMQSMRRFHFGWSFTTTRNTSNEKKKNYQDNCSWPNWRGILQSSKTKTASSEEWMNDTMDWIETRYFNRWRTYFRKFIPFTQTWNSWICRGKKNDFELLRKFFLFKSIENLVDERGKKVSIKRVAFKETKGFWMCSKILSFKKLSTGKLSWRMWEKK